MNLNAPKIIFISVSTVFLLVMGNLLLDWLNRARLVVTTDDGATISIATERGGEFEVIGDTKAEFSSGDAGTVYVRVDKDGDSTLGSAFIENRQTTEVMVGLESSSTPQMIAKDALTHPYSQGKFVYGINPNTRSLAYGTDDDSRTIFTFFGLPQVRSVVWENRNNFAFNTYGNGIGSIVKGKVKPITPGDKANLNQDYLTVVRYTNKPFVLLGNEGIYTTTKPGVDKLKRLVKLGDVSGAPNLFADSDLIYYVNATFESVKYEDDAPAQLNTQLRAYDYKGKLVHNLDVDIAETVNRITKLGASNTLLLLGESKVYAVDTTSGSVSESPFYFQSAVDMLGTSEGVMVLGTDGLWRYDLEDGVFYLVSSFDDSQEYVPDSLVMSPDMKSILYSASANEGALRDLDINRGSAVYRIDL